MSPKLPTIPYLPRQIQAIYINCKFGYIFGVQVGQGRDLTDSANNPLATVERNSTIILF